MKMLFLVLSFSIHYVLRDIISCDQNSYSPHLDTATWMLTSSPCYVSRVGFNWSEVIQFPDLKVVYQDF